MGSPASNHLARIVNSSAIFRFNYSQVIEQAIDEIIANARALSPAQLVGYSEQEYSHLAAKMRLLFAGGILDPTHPGADYVAATYFQLAMNTAFDFGVLTFAANPYYALKCKREERECDHKYISIMAAGIHHPATAHALRLLGQDCRGRGVFDKHPYGGVLRVELDMSVPFSMRTMEAACKWEDEIDDDRSPSDDQKDMLCKQLKTIEKKIGKHELTNLALKEGQAAECLKLINML